MEVSDETRKIVLESIAQGWCEPEVSHKEMDCELVAAIAKPVGRFVQSWMDTAAFHCRNEHYYRDIVRRIGKLLGPEAYTSDDGSVQDEVLSAKVYELVESRLKGT